MSRYNRELIDEHVLVSLDPGKRVCGVAIWDGVTGRLMRAAAVDSGSAAGSPHAMLRAVMEYVGDYGPVPVLWVIEQPKRYRVKRATHEGVKSLEDVLDLVRSACTVAASYMPFVWKSTVPKAIHQRRFARALAPAELIGAEDWDHNAWDAVGLGLYALGRTDNAGRNTGKRTG